MTELRVLPPDYLRFQPAYALSGTDGGLWRCVLDVEWLASLGGDPVERGACGGEDGEGVIHLTGGGGAQNLGLEVGEDLTGLRQYSAGPRFLPQEKGDEDFDRHQPPRQLHVQFVQRAARCIALVCHALLSLPARWWHYGEGRGK